MSLFSDTHAPPSPRPPAGDIPVDVCQAILDWFNKRGVSSSWIWARFKEILGYGNYEHVGTDVLARFGDDAAERFVDELKSGRKVGAGTADVAHWVARGALSGLPAPLFLDATSEAIWEYASALARAEYYSGARDPISYINELFERRGISYRANDDGRFEWVGDAGAAALVVHPAIDALADARLEGARGDFDTALGHLRKGTDKDYEQAVHEAGKAVESAMKSVLDDHGVPRDPKDAAQVLFNHLVGAQIVPTQSEAAILGSLRLRNAFGGHGSGPKPHVVPAELATLAVQSAAGAIVYLAEQLT